jgi:hypothetical protein
MRRMREATPAGFALSGGQGAARAARRGEPRQVAGARAAQDFPFAFLSAEQAILCEQALGEASGAGGQARHLS